MCPVGIDQYRVLSQTDSRGMKIRSPICKRALGETGLDQPPWSSFGDKFLRLPTTLLVLGFFGLTIHRTL